MSDRVIVGAETSAPPAQESFADRMNRVCERLRDGGARPEPAAREATASFGNWNNFGNQGFGNWNNFDNR